MIKIAKTVRPDLILINGENAVDLFDYFNVDTLHGLNRKDCLNRIETGNTYIDGMCNLIPETNGKIAYYIFINDKALTKNSIANYGLIFHEATHYAFRKYWESLQENEENIVTESENLAIDIYKILF